MSGIEISETAVLKARKQFGNETVIHHGSVNDMPFNSEMYDAIYCYSLIHLLKQNERKTFLESCFQQLKPSGLMIMVALSTNDHRYGIGQEVAKNTYKSPNSLNLFFYDEVTIKTEFSPYNIERVQEISTPNKPNIKPFENMWMIVCSK